MTAPDRAALGERAARALQAWEKGAGFDVLLRLVVDFASIEIAGENAACAEVAAIEARCWEVPRDTLQQGMYSSAKSIENDIRKRRARGTESKTGGR